jgi:hypothetical protein
MFRRFTQTFAIALIAGGLTAGPVLAQAGGPGAGSSVGAAGGAHGRDTGPADRTGAGVGTSPTDSTGMRSGTGAAESELRSHTPSPAQDQPQDPMAPRVGSGSHVGG